MNIVFIIKNIAHWRFLCEILCWKRGEMILKLLLFLLILGDFAVSEPSEKGRQFITL